MPAKIKFKPGVPLPNRSQPDDTTLTIRLPRELADAFDKACAQADRTRSQIMRDLIRAWLDNQNSPRLPL